MNKTFAMLFILLFSISLTGEEKKASTDVKRIGNPAPAGAAVKEIEVSAKSVTKRPKQGTWMSLNMPFSVEA